MVNEKYLLKNDKFSLTNDVPCGILWLTEGSGFDELG